MKTGSDFKNFYNSELIKELEIVEKQRKSILFQLAVTTLIVVGFIGAYVYWFSVVWNGPTYLLLYVPTFAFVLLAAYKTYGIIIKNTSFYKHFKDKVIFKTITFLQPNLSFDKKFFISKDQFFESGIFEEQAVKYKGEDYVSGNLEDDVAIEFCELNVRYSNQEVAKKKHKEHLFRGIFYKAKLPFLFPINFVIEPVQTNAEDKNVEVFKTGHAAFDYSFQIRILKKNEEFNPSLFLTNQFLEGILKFAEKYHDEIRISFVDNYIYAAIDHDKELFEPLVFSGNKNFEFIYMHYQDLSFPINLIQNITIDRQLEEIAA